MDKDLPLVKSCGGKTMYLMGFEYFHAYLPEDEFRWRGISLKDVENYWHMQQQRQHEHKRLSDMCMSERRAPVEDATTSPINPQQTDMDATGGGSSTCTTCTNNDNIAFVEVFALPRESSRPKRMCLEMVGRSWSSTCLLQRHQ